MEIVTSLKKDHYLMSISGKIDTDNLAVFNENLEKCLNILIPALLVDCNNLTHFSVAGLRSLLRYQKLFQSQNKTIILFGLNPQLESIFFETGLDRFIFVTFTYNQALNLVRQS